MVAYDIATSLSQRLFHLSVIATAGIDTGIGGSNAACTSASGSNLFNCPFTINERTNGGGGKTLGFELAGTWIFASGFGIQGNYTWVDAEADSGDPLPGASESQFNLSGFYEADRLSARLSYTYRSKFFVTFDRSTQLDQDALESLDASLQYRFNDRIAFTLDAINLTEETIEQFAGNTNRPRAIYSSPAYAYNTDEATMSCCA